MEIEKLAKLARISLSSEEKEKLQKEFEAILGYISILKEADTSGLESGFSKAEVLNVMRSDEKAHKSGEFTKELLEVAPAYRTGRPFVEDNFVKVKHVFE